MNYPYYIIPFIEEHERLRAEGAEEECRRLETLLSVNIGDPDVLADILGRTPEPFDDFYNDRSASTPDTGDTINIFLSNFGSPGMASSSVTLPEEVPVIPAIDYASSFLERKPTSRADNHSEQAPLTSGNTPEPAPLTESLVKILVKNRKYEEALQIIRDLNLNNPEKSIYFADQIRFLRKVLLSQQKNKS